MPWERIKGAAQQGRMTKKAQGRGGGVGRHATTTLGPGGIRRKRPRPLSRDAPGTSLAAMSQSPLSPKPNNNFTIKYASSPGR
jgi:hypothetical protein